MPCLRMRKADGTSLVVGTSQDAIRVELSEVYGEHVGVDDRDWQLMVFC